MIVKHIIIKCKKKCKKEKKYYRIEKKKSEALLICLFFEKLKFESGLEIIF